MTLNIFLPPSSFVTIGLVLRDIIDSTFSMRYDFGVFVGAG